MENVAINFERVPETVQRSSVELLDKPEWIIPAASSKIPKINHTSEDTSRESVIFSNGKCTRYCIANGINRGRNYLQYINISWSGNVTSESPVAKGRSQLAMPETRWADEQNAANVPRKCQMYLDLDCGTAETETSANSMRTKVFSTVQNAEENEGDADGSSKPTFEMLVNVAERCDLTGETETKFLVNDTVDRIVMNVEGNVSSAVLRIPMNVTGPWLGTVVSWTRKGETDGVRIDTNNAPPGEWWIKLLGEDNSKYHFTADGFARPKDAETTGQLFSPNLWLSDTANRLEFIKHHPKENSFIKSDGTTNDDDFEKVFYSRTRTLEEQNSDLRIDPNMINDEKLMHERFLERTNETTPENFNENDTSMSSIPRNINFVEYANFADDENVTVSRNNHSVSFVEDLSTQEQHGIGTRSSMPLSENIDVDMKRNLDNSNLPVKMVETSENLELFEELVNYSNENTIQEKRMLIEVNRNSNLIAAPGSIHRIIFDVMNNCILPVRYGFRVKSTPFIVYNVVPTYAWIYPGQMSKVAVDINVPANTSPDTANTVTLYIQGTEIKEKSAYIYVQGSLSKLTDDVQPKVTYSFNNNCAGKLDKSQCYKTRWSVDLTIEDYDSGLKRVISSLNEVYPRTDFISGTRGPVTFFYSATCCDTATKITAVDLLNNYNTITIDVTEWNNLSEAQIAAISVGALLAVLFIILIIILIICCVRRRKSLDLPYSQRYGSRPPAQAERTNL
ncbi:uncharacterized protein LOC143209165 isoform X2 [Lasioglossum baleicum]|uniref:uncharacterized protein LOC143209165 isoform X2 n=1 Tax=Lasioglossum baleicum TaxID=434251 RepID=UPI003FCD5A5F